MRLHGRKSIQSIKWDFLHSKHPVREIIKDVIRRHIHTCTHTHTHLHTHGKLVTSKTSKLLLLMFPETIIWSTPLFTVQISYGNPCLLTWKHTFSRSVPEWTKKLAFHWTFKSYLLKVSSWLWIHLTNCTSVFFVKFYCFVYSANRKIFFFVLSVAIKIFFQFVFC